MFNHELHYRGLHLKIGERTSDAKGRNRGVKATLKAIKTAEAELMRQRTPHERTRHYRLNKRKQDCPSCLKFQHELTQTTEQDRKLYKKKAHA